MNPIRQGQGREMEDDVWEGKRFSVQGLRGREKVCLQELRGRERARGLDGCDCKIAYV